MTDKREKGRVVRTFYGREDHGVLTCSLYLEFPGSGQAFGNLCLDERTGPAFVSRICALFRVGMLPDCEGQECYALRCLGTLNDPIEGLESMRGERFTITSFQRMHWPEENKTRTRLDGYAENLLQTIAWARRRAEEASRDLATLKERYTEWG